MSNCSFCNSVVLCSCIATAKNKLMHGSDRPLTDFVIIFRGCRLLAERKVNTEIAANAIMEALQELGFLSSNNPILETGS